LFYSNNFRSVKKDYIDFKGLGEKYFPSEGGVLYKFISGFVDQNYNIRSLSFISELVQTIENYRPESSVAIISPFRETVKKLQSELQTDSRKLRDFTVETIDRIQGMTVDYAVLYLPAGDSNFALDVRRFNVATSRSLSTTIIISDVRLEKLAKFKGKVKTFIQACKQVD
jgi:predicted P-loop ATPase/GTPase